MQNYYVHVHMHIVLVRIMYNVGGAYSKYAHVHLLLAENFFALLPYKIQLIC